MHVFLTLLRRELGTYFVSITGYVIIAAVALMCGLSFCVLISGDRKSTRLNSSHLARSRMPSSA